MSEASFPLSLRSFSPLWKWSSVGNDSNQGWAVLCAEKVAQYRCDDHAAHYTTSVASANLTFYGTAISLYANATGGMEWSIAIDGVVVGNNTSTSGSPVVLLSSSGLSSREHVLTLTTHPGASGATFTVDRAEITVGTGQSRKNVSTSFVDSENSVITYSSGFWHDYGGYPNTYIPPGANNNHFTGSNTPNDKATLVFNATAIVWYGPCYLACGPYSVSIDSEPATTYDGEWDTPTAVAEGCVRFLRSDLDPSKQHAITINVTGTGYVNIDYFQLFTVPGGGTITGNTPSTLSSSSSPSKTASSPPTTQPSSISPNASPNVAAIAGAVIGGIGVIVIALVLSFIWQRRKYKKDRTIKPVPLSDKETLDGEEEGSSTHSAAALSASHAGPDLPGAAVAPRRPGPAKPRINPVSNPQLQRNALQTDYTASPVDGGSGTMTQQSSPTHTSPQGNFNPASFDYRPLEKPLTIPSRSTLPSSHVLGTASEAGPPRANPSLAGDLPRVVVGGGSHNHSPSFSSYPMGSISDESSRRGFVASPQRTAPPVDSHGVTLSQLSHDVNRILTQLGRFRITPGEPVEGGIELHQTSPLHDPVFDDGTSPPEYGEHEGGAAVTVGRAPTVRAPLPPIPPHRPPESA